MADPTQELTRSHVSGPIPQPGTYTIDQSHSTVSFVARHLVVSKVRGEFHSFSGDLVVAEEPTDSSVAVTIDVASISTREDQRDAHLKSGDFFEVETYPTITFTSTAVRPAGGGTWEIVGDLTIKGTTKEVVLETEFNGATSDPWGGSRVGFSASTEIDREEFGLTWNAALETGGVVVGRTVKIEIEIEAVRKA